MFRTSLTGAERDLDRIRVLVEPRRTTYMHSSANGCSASALQRQVMIGQVPCGEQSADQDEVRTEQQLQLHPEQLNLRHEHPHALEPSVCQHRCSEASAAATV